MPIRVRVTLFDAGANGVPTNNNPHTLRNLDDYEQTIVNEGGFESLQASFRAPTRAAAQAYLDRLMCGVIATSPRGRTIWEGFVQEVTVEIDGQTTTMSLADMANQIVVRYKNDAGAQVSGAPVVDSASIARYGTKTRLINFATTTAAAATNRAGVILKQIGSPRSKQKRSAGSGAASTGYKVTIRCRGWWDTLAWLLTASTSTSTAVTSTQATSLITTYNATNNFFSVDMTNVVATGISDTNAIEADTTYQDAIATKLASGDSAQQRVVYGCYEGRRITIRPWAYATPSSYTYVQRAGDPTIRDAYGSIVPIWDVRPDAIVLLPDLTLPASTTTALDRPDRMYVRRVRVKLGRNEQTIDLEPDDADSIEDLLTRPNGTGVAGTSARQAAIERVVAAQAQTRFSGTNGTVDLGGGSITAPGGVVTITPPGGTPTTLPTSGGAALTGSGTVGSLAKWTGSAALGNAVAGTDYAAASHSHTSGDISNFSEAVDDRVAALLVAGAGISLSYNDASNTLTISNAGGTVGGTGTAGRIPQWATGGADLENSTLAKTGAGVLTLSAAGAATLTIDSNTRLDGTGATSGQVLAWDGTAFAPTTLTPAAIGAIDGSGTAGRLAQWSDADTLAAATLIKSGAGVLTLSAAGAYTLTIPATGTAALGSGTANQIAYWSDANTLTSDTDLRYDGTRMALGATINASYRLLIRGTGTTGSSFGLVVQSSAGTNNFYVDDSGGVQVRTSLNAGSDVSAGNAVRTALGVGWDFGGFTASGDASANGYVTVIVNGTSYKLMTRA